MKATHTCTYIHQSHENDDSGPLVVAKFLMPFQFLTFRDFNHVSNFHLLGSSSSGGFLHPDLPRPFCLGFLLGLAWVGHGGNGWHQNAFLQLQRCKIISIEPQPGLHDDSKKLNPPRRHVILMEILKGWAIAGKHCQFKSVTENVLKNFGVRKIPLYIKQMEAGK